MGKTGPEGVTCYTCGCKYGHRCESNPSSGCRPVSLPKRAPLLVTSLLTIAIAQSLVGSDSVALAQTASPPLSTPTIKPLPALQLSEVNTPSMLKHAISMSSERERVEADHQEVDSMAVRIKEMIDARYHAEAVLFKDAQMTIAALKQQIIDLEQLRSDKNGAYNALLAERDGLNQQLSLMQAQRDSARDDINVLAGEIDNQRGAVETLRANIATATDQLVNRENAVNDLKDELALQQGSGEQLEGALAATEDKLKDKSRQLALAEERLADTRQQLGELRGQLSDLKVDRNNAFNEIASIRRERDTAEQRANSLLSERENLAGKLSLFRSKSNDVDSALKAEQQLHAQSRETAELLEEEIEARTKHRDELLVQKEGLENDRQKLTADLDSVRGQLQLANKKLQSRQQELKIARNDLKDATDRLDVANTELGHLNGQLASANDEIGKLTSRIGQLDNTVAKLNTNQDQARASISSLKSSGSTLQKQIDQRDRDLLQLNSRVSELVAELNDLSAQSENDINSRDERISNLAAQVEELQRVKSNLLAEGERATETMENLHNLIASLESKEKKTAGMLSELQSDVREEVDDLQQQLAGSEDKFRNASEQLNALLLEKRTLEAQRDAVYSEAEKLRVALTDELRAAKLENVTVQSPRADNSIPLRLGNADFFAVGSAELTKEGGENLKKLAEIISNFHDRRIVVEGHTDNVQIGYRLRPKFATNWELSVARAAAAVRHMQYQSNINPHKLSAVGYGEYAPLASNETKEGRQMNRRVEVVLYPRQETEEKFEFSGIDE